MEKPANYYEYNSIMPLLDEEVKVVDKKSSNDGALVVGKDVYAELYLPFRKFVGSYYEGEKLYFVTRRMAVHLVVVLKVEVDINDLVYTIQFVGNPLFVTGSRYKMFEMYRNLEAAKTMFENCDDYFLRNGCDDVHDMVNVKEKTFCSVLSAPSHASAVVVTPMIGGFSSDIVTNSYHVDTWAIYEITDQRMVKVLVEDIVMVTKKMTNDEEIVEYHFVLRDCRGFLYNVKSTENRMMIYFPCLETMCS